MNEVKRSSTQTVFLETQHLPKNLPIQVCYNSRDHSQLREKGHHLMREEGFARRWLFLGPMLLLPAACVPQKAKTETRTEGHMRTRGLSSKEFTSTFVEFFGGSQSAEKDQLRNDAAKIAEFLPEIWTSTVGIACEEKEEPGKFRFRGTGLLVQIREKKGLLSAGHVLETTRHQKCKFAPNRLEKNTATDGSPWTLTMSKHDDVATNTFYDLHTRKAKIFFKPMESQHLHFDLGFVDFSLKNPFKMRDLPFLEVPEPAKPTLPSRVVGVCFPVSTFGERTRYYYERITTKEQRGPWPVRDKAGNILSREEIAEMAKAKDESSCRTSCQSWLLYLEKHVSPQEFDSDVRVCMSSCTNESPLDVHPRKTGSSELYVIEGEESFAPLATLTYGRLTNAGSTTFRSDLDLVEGCSGGPIFHINTGKLLGIGTIGTHKGLAPDGLVYSNEAHYLGTEDTSLRVNTRVIEIFESLVGKL